MGRREERGLDCIPKTYCICHISTTLTSHSDGEQMGSTVLARMGLDGWDAEAPGTRWVNGEMLCWKSEGNVFFFL